MLKKIYFILLIILSTSVFSSDKVVYLTFDDGPNSDYTIPILDILKEENVPSTWFLIGPQIIGREHMLKRMQTEGHVLGLHSMTHNAKILYDKAHPENFINEMQEVQDIIYNSVGERPIILRFPYGTYGTIYPVLADKIAEKGWKVWDWHVDSLDWKYSNNPSKVYHLSTKTKRKNVVVLFHNRKSTMLALKNVIKYYKDNGYEFRAWKPEEHYMLNSIKDPRL